MGCASSRDRCIAPPLPLPLPSPPPPPPPIYSSSLRRRFPSPIVVHHPPLHRGDSHHLVSLTSTTYRSLDPQNQESLDQENQESPSPRSPTTVIDAWDLMAGLDESAPSGKIAKKPTQLPRCMSYHHHHQLRPPVRPLWRHLADDNPKRPPAPGVVLYTTSLRGIRRTHEDCSAVRAILRGLRVALDERDVSMDAALRRELQSLLGKQLRPPLSLPQVFIGGKHVGGAEEIKQMHEAGELGRLLVGVPVQDPAYVCAGCGGVRFVPCGGCSGSRKVFAEDEGRMRRCEDCNENGLVRCPNCSSY